MGHYTDNDGSISVIKSSKHTKYITSKHSLKDTLIKNFIHIWKDTSKDTSIDTLKDTYKQALHEFIHIWKDTSKDTSIDTLKDTYKQALHDTWKDT